MPDLRSAGVAVAVGDPEHTLGTSLMIVETADGESLEEPAPVGPIVHFELRLFVDLDNGSRVLDDRYETADLDLSLPLVGPDGSRMTTAEFEAEVRACVFDDDLREIEEELREEDPEILIGPDWTPHIARLSEIGVEANTRDVETLPFVVECDAEVMALLRK